jgi:hypothetical protein
MGFLSKAFKKVKKQIQPGNMIARDMGPGNMPRRPDIFGGNSFLFGRKPDMTSIRMPRLESSYSPLELAERKARARVEAGKQDLFQKNRKDRSKKRGGGFGNLGEAIRRMQEQGGMGIKSDGIWDPRIPGGMFSPGGRDRIMPNRGTNAYSPRI